MKEKILDLLNDECYDILDVFEPEVVATLIEAIVSRIKARKNEKGLGPVVTAQLGKYVFKVNNSPNGFVSCSDEDDGCTGVSSTLYYPYYDDDYDCGLINLIEMVNEAWYSCVNG